MTAPLWPVLMMTAASPLADVGAAHLGASALSPMLPADHGVSGEQRGESAWELRPFAIEVDLGVATPVGALGVMIDTSPSSRFSIGCGLGTNLYFRTISSGFEGACMMHLRPLSGRERALSLGVGASVGSFEKSEVSAMGAFGPLLGPMTAIREGPGPRDKRWDVAAWLNFDIGYERRTVQGATFRVYLGVAQLLNPGSGRETEPPDPNYDPGVVKSSTTLLYFGVAFGRAW